MKRIYVALALLLILAGCQNVGQAVQEPVKIGVISAHTSPVAAISVPSKNAIELAFSEFDSDVPLEIIYEDNRGKPTDTASAYNKLVNVDGVSAIITDISMTTMTVAPFADRDEIPVVAYISTSPSVFDVSDYVYRTSPMNIEGMKITAEHMIESNVDKIVTLTEIYDYPIALQEVFEPSFTSLGGIVLSDERFEMSNDLRAVITKAMGKDPDALMIFVQTPGTAIEMLKQIRELGIDVPIYGSENFGSDLTLALGGASLLEDVYVSNPVYDDARMAVLKEKYSAQYDETKILDWLYIGTGYDAANILFAAVDEVGSDPDAIKEFLDTQEQFGGVTGIEAFDEYGDPAEGRYALVQWNKGEKIAVN